MSANLRELLNPVRQLEFKDLPTMRNNLEIEPIHSYIKPTSSLRVKNPEKKMKKVR